MLTNRSNRDRKTAARFLRPLSSTVRGISIGMNPTIFAQILVRVLAVYLIAQAIIVIPQIASFPFVPDVEFEDNHLVYWVVSLAFLMPLLVGVALWLTAPHLAKVIVGRNSSTTSEASLTINAVVGSAISVAGLLIIFIYLPSFVSTWVQYEAAGSTFNADQLRVHLIAQGARVCFGILLLVGVRYWVVLIHRFRELGLEK